MQQKTELTFFCILFVIVNFEEKEEKNSLFI